MVTGKLEGAWRVVARSLPRRLSASGILSPEPQGTRTAIWRQKLCTSKLQERDSRLARQLAAVYLRG